ncbi:FadR/GntR family transcriptional regulator [Asticcacaulis sp. EMRT-3]|uniref:FadR/GntR family transcriptional regulator n=1 Tax=Asticcacaulis sp. EMRT-3 TaxID=3040349 RepID=UPI0024AF395B|nr:FadR/GntR family transcriptional regulator [Asticcacaulis sp. EMRT-3]MDI7776675.1 FadR/GntR family transcriptional regulator [Asticcacaulis sp. EMRT-3]
MSTSQQPDRLYRRVADQIIIAIAQGTYGLGEKLPAERELAEAFGVSRPTVREAMIALELQGIIEIRDRSGIYITQTKNLPAESLSNPPDLNVGAFELIEARILIESDAAGIAAEGATASDLDILRTYIKSMDSDDVEICEQADRDFHVHIASMTHNGALIAMVELLWDLRKKSPLASQIMSRAQGGGLEARLSEHAAIMKAIEAKDTVAARKAMQQHLEQVREYLLDATEAVEIDQLRTRLKLKRQAVINRTKRLKD